MFGLGSRHAASTGDSRISTPMSSVGDVFESPPTRERVVVRVGNAETGGKLLVLDVYVQPGGAVVGEHVHASLVETFVLVRGRIGVRLNGQESFYDQPGARVNVPTGMAHYWWNANEGETRMLLSVRPGLRFEQMVLRQLYGLAKDGRTDALGRPSLLQAAVITQEFGDVTRFTQPSPAKQRLLFGVLAPIARIRGYHALDPAYAQEQPPKAELEPLPPELERLVPTVDM